MAKKLVRLTESDLQNIIKESVNSILNEKLYGMNRLQGEELYDRIDEYLSKIGDVKVCRFYCTDSTINIAMNQTLGKEGKSKIFNIMGNLGYKCVNAGGNEEYIMYDFKSDLQENINKLTNKLNESEENIPAHKFLLELNKTYHNLHREYSKWQYSPAKPEGMDDAIDAIINAMHAVKDIIDDIKWEQEGKPIYDTDDPRQY